MGLAEYQLISKLLNDKDYSIITENLIDESNFVETLDEFKFIKSFHEQYGSVPDKTTFTVKFPTFDYLTVDQPTQSVIDDLREETLFRKAVALLNTSTKLFEQNSNQGAQYLIDHIGDIRPQYSFTCTDIVHDTSRYNEWQDKLENPTNYFIPSGFKELDENLFGWYRKEEFALVMARSGVGKTFFLIKTAQHSMSLGYRVGFFSPEMSVNTLGYRFDSANASFSNMALLKGAPVADYKDYMDNLKNTEGHFYVVETKDFDFDGDDAVTVPKLRQFCVSKKLDILFIDGFDYLSDCRAKKSDSREDRLGHIAKDLLNLSIELQIPVVSVIQANRKGTDDTKDMGTENITGADKIGASCTRLLTLRANGPAMQMMLPKNRYGKSGADTKVLYSWNADDSNFYFIPNLEDIQGDSETAQEAEEFKEASKNVF